MTTAGAFALGLIATGLLLKSPVSHADDSNSESQIQRGLAAAPVPLNLKGKNRAWVAQGSYLVNAVGGCNDCHTWRRITPDGQTGSNYEAGRDPYVPGQTEKIYQAGYLAGGRPFGPFESRNITPDKNGVVADGYATFLKIMRTGFDPDGMTPVLQVMPWPVHRNMTDNDLRSIYEYLTAIPCREGNPGESFANPDGIGNATNRCGN